jgi:hypothetical protein
LHYDILFRELEPVRQKATRWALDHVNDFSKRTVSVPETLHDRAQDLWRPLLTIAEHAGANWPERARRAAIELAGTVAEDDNLPVQLLTYIQDLFRFHQTHRLSSETIVHSLADPETSPWPDRLPLTKAQLARLLAPFGFGPPSSSAAARV